MLGRDMLGEAEFMQKNRKKGRQTGERGFIYLKAGVSTLNV